MTDNRVYQLENTARPASMETLDFRGKTYYLVFTEEQLRAISAGQYGMDKDFMQQADNQMSTDEWIPIGTYDKPFTGSYQGNGYEIKGLTMKNTRGISLILVYGNGNTKSYDNFLYPKETEK